jgi:carboxymethylenebutenolidase
VTITRQAIPVEDGALPLTVARAGGTGAAVVIVPSAFGVGPDLEAQMVETAGDARAVVAIDPFFRADAGPVAYDDRDRAIGRLQALDRARTLRDLGAAIAWVRDEEGGAAVVVLGICFGGPFALAAAAEGLAQGVVTWHGTRMEQALARAVEMRCPMRLHFGAVDPFVPMAAVATVRAAFADRADVVVTVHEGATHGFSHRGSARSYDAEAEQSGLASLRELVHLLPD